MNHNDANDEQIRVWNFLYGKTRLILNNFGSEDVSRAGDFWIDDDNLGTQQQKIYVRNLSLLRPSIIKSLQLLLSQFRSWEIIVAVSVPGAGDLWPDMSVIIRTDEIVDNLRREYLPEEFRDIRYEASRPPADGE